MMKKSQVDLKKYILLDIDGVCNGVVSCRRPAVVTGSFGIIDESYMGMDPVCVERVNRIQRATNAVIVLETSWVTMVGLDVTIEHLRWNGLEGPIEGATPRRFSSYKVNEITWWLCKNPDVYRDKRFVILDDDKRLLSHYGHREVNFDDNLVLTDTHVGIQDPDVALAIKILQSTNP